MKAPTQLITLVVEFECKNSKDEVTALRKIAKVVNSLRKQGMKLTLAIQADDLFDYLPRRAK